MTDEEFLKSLVEVAAERPTVLDRRWDALAADELPDDDRAALKRLADQDPEYSAALQAFEPRPKSVDNQITDSVVAAVVGPQTTQTTPLTPTPPHGRKWAWAAIPILLAAGLAFFVLNRQTPESRLPSYSLKTGSGEHPTRGVGSNATLPKYGPGSLIDIVARPSVDLTVPPAGRAFVLHDKTLHQVPGQLSCSPTGVFRLVGLVEEVLPLLNGKQTLILVLGDSDMMPSSLAELDEAPEERWQVLQYDFERRLKR